MSIKLKVCGLHDIENILDISGLPIDYFGFIYYQESKRFVGNKFVCPKLDDQRTIGVFVNSSEEEIIKQISKNHFQLVQLHGGESPEFCNSLKKHIPIIKAFGVDKNFDFAILNDYQEHCDYFLFDTKTPAHGGSGIKFDHQLLKKYNLDKPYFLSGGIDLDDIKNILDMNLPQLHAIDVNSKFEIRPGMKNIDKIKELTELMTKYI